MHPIKKTLICLTVLLLVLFQTATAQWLRIYHIGVGQGDCTLIIGRDIKKDDKSVVTFSMLIDCGGGNRAMNVGKRDLLWEFITDTLNTYAAGVLNYVVVSHLHADHMNVMSDFIGRMAGVPSIKNNLRIIDRLAFTKVYGNPVDKCWNYAPSNTIKLYVDAVNKNFPKARYLCEPNTQILPPLENISIQCLSANGVANGASFIPTSGPKSENDLSFSFLITFNGFHYFTGGDIGGGSPYADGETPIATYVYNNYPKPFHTCCMKVSHHGSGHSTNENFLKVFSPYAAVIPSALASFNGTRIPTKGTIETLTGIGTRLYYTYWVEADHYWIPPADTYADVDYFINSPPGFEKDIAITVSEQDRDRSTLELLGDPLVRNIFCNKPHPKPTALEEEHLQQLYDSAPKPVPSSKVMPGLPKTTHRVNTKVPHVMH